MHKILVVALLLAAAFAKTAAAEELAGDWIGQLNGAFKVRIHVEKTGSGYTGTLINPSGNETVLDEISSDGKHLHFGVKKLELSYDGDWNEKDKLWNGSLKFQQVYPLVLKRATAEEIAGAVHKRPQEEAIVASTPLYTEREVNFANKVGLTRLAGTLSVPSGDGPFPAVVLVSGTGHNTRDEDVWGHKVFLILADALSRNGIAVLRYDKRGVGGSSGDYDAATTADFTSDAASAVAWLRTQPNIDAKRVGVLGHSEGGIIAPAVGAADENVAFVVMIAGPCIRGDKLFVLQSAMTAKVYGAPADYIAKRKKFDEELFSAIISAKSEAEAIEQAKALVATGVADKVVDANEAESLARDSTSPWERHFLAYDPAPTLTKLKVPVLAVNGALDVQVPAKENLAAAREALKNNPDATVTELPGMNHLLQDAKTGAPSEYNDIEETMSPVALKLITSWVSAHTAMPSSR